MERLETRSCLAAGAMVLAAVALLTVTPNPVHAEPPGSCAEALSQTETANAWVLFDGVALCAAEDNAFDMTLLLILGQTRGMVDLTLLEPADGGVASAAVELYQAIFYRYGGLGSDDVFADRSAAERLVARVEDWSPVFDAQYDPGWAYRASDRQALYATVAREHIERRLYQIRRRVALLADPSYAALSQEIAALDRETEATYTVGTEAYARHLALQERRRTLEAEILAEFPPPPQGSVLDGLPPEVHGDVRNLYSGVNGPVTSGHVVFLDSRAVRASWIVDALSEGALERLLSEINFETEVLIAVWIGQQARATGTMLVTSSAFSEASRAWTVSVGVGVLGSDCDVIDTATSYPFALAAVPRPSGSGEIRGYARSNFADGCESAATASTP